MRTALLGRFIRLVYAFAGAFALSIGITQLKFATREAAGDILAQVLWASIPNIEHRQSIVLGIPRGGVIVAKQVAINLSAELGVIAAKKILAPGNDEDAVGAVVAGEREYLDLAAINKLKMESGDLGQSLARAKKEATYRHTLYLGEAYQFPNLQGKTAILVDDGAATGSTLIASARFVRKFKPSLLVIGVPVATKTAMIQLEKEADKVVTVTEAKSKFRAVGQYYRSFVPVAHEEVLEVLNNLRSRKN